MKVVCFKCGKEFDKKSTKVGVRNYCSRTCLGVANGERSKKLHLMVCDYCGKEFEQHNRHTARNTHFFCSPECGWAAKVKKAVVHCDWCGLPFEKKCSGIARYTHNFCDRGCYQDFINFSQAGARNQVVGGKVLYRILAEMKIGRELTVDEEVHHIDGDHTNNDIDNLKVISRSEHMSVHAASKRRCANGHFVK